MQSGEAESPLAPEVAPSDWEAASVAGTEAGAAALTKLSRGRRGIPWSVWLVAVFGPSLVGCIIAIVFLLSSQAKDRAALKEARARFVHPLVDMPDYGWFFHEGGKRTTIADPTQQPAKEVFVRLNETAKLGDALEVTPVGVSRRPLRYVLPVRQPSDQENQPVLALRLRLRNTTDYMFHPMDPVYNVAYSRTWPPYTFLELNGREYYGPVRDPAREVLVGQNFEALWPRGVDGRPHEMETLVFAYQDGTGGSESAAVVLERLLKENRLAPGSELLWRVQLRKGRKAIPDAGGRVAWLTTQIIVQFSPSEVVQER